MMIISGGTGGLLPTHWTSAILQLIPVTTGHATVGRTVIILMMAIAFLSEAYVLPYGQMSSLWGMIVCPICVTFVVV